MNFWTWLSFTSVPRCGFLKSFSFRGRGAHPTRTMCKFQNSEGSPVLLMLSLLHYRRSRRKEVVNLSPRKVNFWGTFYLSNWMKMERKPRELASNCFCNCGAKSLWSFFLISNFACFAARPCASIKAKATPSWSESHHASMKIMNLWWLTLLVRPLSCICLAYITTTSSSLAKRLLTECLSGLRMKEEQEEERKTRRILHLMPYHNGKVHY